MIMSMTASDRELEPRLLGTLAIVVVRAVSFHRCWPAAPRGRGGGEGRKGGVKEEGINYRLQTPIVLTITIVIPLLLQKNLPDRSRLGKQDPYCAFKYNNETKRTKKVTKCVSASCNVNLIETG